MRYVVLGSMPATMKLVLSPGTIGSGAVFCQDGLGPSWANWTYIELPAEGGALYRATRGLDVGLTTAAGPDDPRLRRIGRGRGLAGRGAEAVLDDHLDVIGALLHGVPGEAVAGAEVADHLGRTAGRPDAELVDGCRPVAAGRRRPGDRRSDQGDRWSAGRQGDGQEAAILEGLAVRPIPPGTTSRGASGLDPLAKRRQELPHQKDSSWKRCRPDFSKNALRVGAVVGTIREAFARFSGHRNPSEHPGHQEKVIRHFFRRSLVEESQTIP